MNKIWFPNQRVIRTAVQVVLSLSSGIGLFLVIFPQVLEAVKGFLPESWYLWLLGLIATVTAISAALTKIMTIPEVDAFLKKFGAGTSPVESHVVADLDGNLQGMTRREYQKFLEG